MHKLGSYQLVYEITQLPLILFASITPADEPLDLSDFVIPKEARGRFIECRFSIYKPNGQLYEMVQKTVDEITLTPTCNTIPLKMLHSLIQNLTN